MDVRSWTKITEIIIINVVVSITKEHGGEFSKALEDRG